jgi:hypothetical protein
VPCRRRTALKTPRSIRGIAITTGTAVAGVAVVAGLNVTGGLGSVVLSDAELTTARTPTTSDANADTASDAGNMLVVGTRPAWQRHKAAQTARNARHARHLRKERAAKAVAAVRAAHQAASRSSTRTYSGDPRAIARSMMGSRYSWGASEFSCLDSLWNRESGWRVHAANASGAYGIPQALPGSKMSTVGSDWRDNPATQIAWGLGYIKASYGTPCSAWSHSQSQGWY